MLWVTRELAQSCKGFCCENQRCLFPNQKEKLMMDTDTFMTVLRQVAIPNFFCGVQWKSCLYNAVQVRYVVSDLITRAGKPFTEWPFLKDCMLQLLISYVYKRRAFLTIFLYRQTQRQSRSVSY